ncbi:MAG: arginyl-tRNA synthetase [Rhodocyclaceae bacterium]|nr:MAG: arginyl-tRNA synthetase [Rhodocyclaceae bacterium]TND06061.1 MAG: arginyl-tRNA synthetase [Rhodocyclaceae bacterium]
MAASSSSARISFDARQHLASLLRTALASVAPGQGLVEIILERPKQASHGDFASNLAMQLARELKTNPRQIAERLVRELPASAAVAKVEIAGAGFINFTLTPAARTAVVAAVLAAGHGFGRGAPRNGKAAQRLQVEFVSANPTGPLHVGHGRGAAYGASLASLLAFAGFDVTREYYVNDAGRQMDILAVSAWLRYLELFDEPVPFPANGYQGGYVREMAEQVRAAHGDRYVHPAEAVLACLPETEDIEAKLDGLILAGKDLLGEDWAYIHGHVLNEQLTDCRADLEEFGVHFDVWFSERSLYETGMVERAVATLEKSGHIYLQDGAKWFSSTAFGDEKDRVVQRDNGIYTYFASDIAYHLNKFERGFDKVIDVWGADHHGYIPRVKGALAASGANADRLDVTLVQFVSLFRDGQKASMSTRSGEYVTLRQLREEVGNDACRFFYMLRKCDQALDFDLDLAKSESNDNPVYYVQYAHARICSVLAQWDGDAAALGATDLAPLQHEREYALCARLAEFPELIQVAARDYAPHALAFYLKDLAGDFHGWYNAERVLVDDQATREARLALALATRQVLQNGLSLLGVSQPVSM